MVATRTKARTEPAAIAPPVPDDADIPKELRRLHINGKDTMRGEAPRKSTDANVYWWRGAAYAITADTPEEWITAEAHKHRPKHDERRKPRKRTFEQELMWDGDDDEAEDARPSKKQRQSTSALIPPKTTTRFGREVQRTRKSLPNASPFPSTSRRPDTTPRCSVPIIKRDSTLPVPSRSEPAVGVLKDFIEDRKSDAREDGMDIDPLPGAPEVSSPLPPLEPPRMPAGLEMLADVQRLAKINSRIILLQEQYGRMKASSAILALRRKREERLAMEQLASPVQSPANHAMDMVGDRRAYSDDDSLLRAQLTAANERVPDSSNDSTPDPLSESYEDGQNDSFLAEPSNTLVSPAPTPEIEDDSSNFERHDSATASSVCAHSSTTVVSATSIEEELPPKRSSPRSAQKLSRLLLPDKNRGGDKLRWSIGDAPTRNTLPEMRPSQHRGKDERAEDGIFRGRMAGESKQARRRRVNRERELLKTLGSIEQD